MTGKYRYYFPGGNTPEGFASYYRDILYQNEAARIFCIKGGPGTGKSTFMKEIGHYYLNKGYDIDFLKCSSDPDSLDGIVVKDKRTAIIDGTKPHVTDPLNPGAVDEIIDLGVLIDRDKICKDREVIVGLNEEISETFEYAYGYLKCAKILLEQKNRILKKYVSEKEIYDLVLSLEVKQNRNRIGIRKRYFGSALTSAGAVNVLEAIAKNIKDIYLLQVPDGYKMTGIMDIMSQRLINEGNDVEELYCPMSPHKTIEHILSPDADTALFTCNSYHGKELSDNDKVKDIITLEVKPLSDTDKKRTDELQRACDSNMKEALDNLKRAKKLHDDLEEYYIAAMDFSRIEELRNTTIDKINELDG